MEAYLNKEQPEDELVRIRAESLDLICLGFQHGNLEMPDHVVSLSKAMERMDGFCKEVTEKWAKEIQAENVLFHVYACKDGFHLFDYMNGKISEDHRKDERPKSPEKVYIQLMNGGENPPKRIGGEKRVYAEWAEREMEAELADVISKIEEYRKTITWKDLNPEDLFCDVYGDCAGLDYRYSYKKGQTYIRPLTEEEERKKKEFQEKYKITDTYDSLRFMKKGGGGK